MKLLDFEKHLKKHGCRLDRQGANHAIWINPAKQTMMPLPRHKEIKKFLAIGICKNLGIPIP